MVWWIGLCIAFTLFYFFQFVYATINWARIELFKPSSNSLHQNNFSIIVAVRNEEENIQQLLQNLNSLQFPKSQFEIILVDDQSTDQTLPLARKFGADIENLKVLSFDELEHSTIQGNKKRAIQLGVEAAKHEWVLTTDADCELNSNHLNSLDGFIQNYDSIFISGPVVYSTHNWFQHLQGIEFLGLVILGGAYLQAKNPVLCNGANLAFKRDVFRELNGYKGNLHQASGDDIWFMHKVFAEYPHKMHFAKCNDLIVKTKPSSTLSEFVNQRKRWTAKNATYQRKTYTATLAMDYLFYLSIISAFVMALFIPNIWWLVALQASVKFVAELMLYASAQSFFRTKNWMLHYCFAFPFQIIYVVAIYPLSQFSKFNWKNRRFNA
ncbi:MAG: glycosyltransferase [Bacteroidetes bacterium]|nr:glycosyltransferase [Bacteroidota bacterium]